MIYHSDYDDSARFLRLIHPRKVWFEVRAKGPKGAYGQHFQDVEQAANWAAEQSDKPETVAVWVTANPVEPSTWTPDQKLAGDHNIPRRTAFYIDFDSVHPKGDNATDAELDATRVAAMACVEYLTGLGFPEPAVVMSGNGHQVWYRIDLPAEDSPIERFLRAMEARFTTNAASVDTSVYNPSRVGRMPGTMNRKGPDTPDRPQRLAQIVSTPRYLETVSRELLESVAGPEQPAESPAPDSAPLPDYPAGPPILFDVEGFLQRNNWPILAKKPKDGGTLWEIPCPLKPEHKDGGAWIWQGDDGTLWAGCHHAKCAKKTWKDIRNAIDPSFDRSAKESLPANVQDAEYLARLCLKPDTFLLHKESIYEYRAGVWQEQKPEAIKRYIRRVLMAEFNRYGRLVAKAGLDKQQPSVSEKITSSVYGVLTSLIPEVDHNAPCWLDGRKADNLLVCADSVVNLDDLTTQPHTPKLFAVTKLPYRYDPQAACPTWTKYLKSVWPDDADAIALAQEFAGYTLLGANPLQSMLLLQGAKRGGKGVFVRTLCALVGRENTCSISVRNFVKDFALWGARGKSIIIIPDIRAPKNGLPPEIVEILKAITGNDQVDVNGKGRDIVSEPLTGKIIASTNDLLTFEDDSGALFDRLIALKFTRSFLPVDHPDYVEGQDQDPQLENKLQTELPGILNWAIQGLQRVKQRQRFTLPASSNALKEELAAEGSPVKRFVSDCLVREPAGRVPVDDTFQLWEAWCDTAEVDAGSKKAFGKILRSACPWIKNEKADVSDDNGKRPREYRGIAVRSAVPIT